MRASFFAVLLSLTAFQQKCDFRSPALITSSVQSALQPYFPNTRVILDPQKTHEVLALTCVQGAGPKLIQMTAQQIQQQLGQNAFLQNVQRGYLTGQGYRFFAVGFESQAVVLDITTTQIRLMNLPESASAYYRQQCGF